MHIYIANIKQLPFQVGDLQLYHQPGGSLLKVKGYSIFGQQPVYPTGPIIPKFEFNCFWVKALGRSEGGRANLKHFLLVEFQYTYI